MAALIRAGICLLAATLAACERAPTAVRIDRPQTVVHGVLTAGATTVDVHVANALIDGTGWSGIRSRPVTDAVVRLVAGTDTIPLVQLGRACTWLFHPDPGEDPAAGCYSAQLGGGVRSGERYELVVTLRDGRRVTGSTRVPAVPSVAASADTIRVRGPYEQAPTASVQVSWQGVPAGRYAQLRLVPDAERCTLHFTADALTGSFGLIAFDVRGRTSAVVRPSSLVCHDEDRFTRGTGRIIVAAWDENYTLYHEALDHNALLASQAAVGITGAWGVFGSVAVGEKPVVIEVLP